MRVGIKNNSFPNRVLKFLPGRKEKLKKSHITSEEQAIFLERKKREIEKTLDDARYIQRVSAGIIRALSIQLKMGAKLPSLAMAYLGKMKGAFHSATATIKKLEPIEKELANNSQKFLKKNSMLQKG